MWNRLESGGVTLSGVSECWQALSGTYDILMCSFVSWAVSWIKRANCILGQVRNPRQWNRSTPHTHSMLSMLSLLCYSGLYLDCCWKTNLSKDIKILRYHHVYDVGCMNVAFARANILPKNWEGFQTLLEKGLCSRMVARCANSKGLNLWMSLAVKHGQGFPPSQFKWVRKQSSRTEQILTSYSLTFFSLLFSQIHQSAFHAVWVWTRGLHRSKTLDLFQNGIGAFPPGSDMNKCLF